MMDDMVKKIQEWLSPLNLALLLMVTLPFERIPSRHIAGINLRPSLVVGGLLILSAVWTYRRKLLVTSSPQRYFYIFLFFAFLSTLASLNLGRAAYVLVFDIYVFLVAQSLSMVVGSTGGRLRRWLLAGVVISCLFAAYQFFGDILNVPIAWTGLRAGYTKSVLGFPRIQAASLEPLFFANFLLLPLGITLAKGLNSSRWYWWSAVCFMFILLTVSRGGAAAALVTAGVIGLYGLAARKYRATGKIVLSLVGAAVVAYSLMTASGALLKKKAGAKTGPVITYQQHVVDYAEISQPQSERAGTRNVAWSLFVEHPILGVGPGNFGSAAYRLGEVSSPNQTANNLPLEILAETGLLGALSFFVFAASLAITGMRAISQIQELDVKLLGLGALAFLAGAAVQYLTISTLYIMVVWVGIGLLFGVIAYAEPHPKTPRA